MCEAHGQMQQASELQFECAEKKTSHDADRPETELAAVQCAQYSGNPDEVFDLDTVILNHVLHVLDLNRGNKLRAARQLGIGRSTLYRILGNHAKPSR
jgi:transcriptional regulator of acetoin/glycerol metabolism